MAGRDGAQTLVLLVDDSEDNREVYAQYLTMSGFRVEIAVDGVEAVEKAASLKPDVIVMDLSMPRLDGWEATRQIKAAPETTRDPRDRPHRQRGQRIQAQGPRKRAARGTSPSRACPTSWSPRSAAWSSVRPRHPLTLPAA